MLDNFVLWWHSFRPWLIVPTIACVHTTCAIAILFDETVTRITAMSVIAELFGSLTVPVLIIASMLAIIPLFLDEVVDAWVIHLLLWPQQLLLFIAALSTVGAIVNGVYPDQYRPSSRWFIFADQSIIFYLFFGHLLALMRNGRGRK